MQEIPDQLHLTITERRRYAAKHNYYFQYTNLTSDVSPVWQKLPAITDAMIAHPDADWIWWLDQDCIIMNESIDLHDHLLSPSAITQRQREVEGTRLRGLDKFTHPLANVTITPVPYDQLETIVSQNHEGVNAGSLFIRNSPWSRQFIDLWGDWYFQHPIAPVFEEQGILTHLIASHDWIRDRVGFVDASVINAEWYNYPEGGLVVHFAGCWVEGQCLTRWTEFSALKASIM